MSKSKELLFAILPSKTNSIGLQSLAADAAWRTMCVACRQANSLRQVLLERVCKGTDSRDQKLGSHKAAKPPFEKIISSMVQVIDSATSN